MALIITEGKDKLRLDFEFSDDWIAYKYDEPSKENFMEAVEGYLRRREGLLRVMDRTGHP